jgi:hypothetical protein
MRLALGTAKEGEIGLTSKSVAWRRRLLFLLGVFVLAGVLVTPSQATVIFGCPIFPHASVTSCSLTLSGTQATANFTIAPGFEDVQVSLGVYRKPAPENSATYPQTLIDSATGLFDDGAHSLQADLPVCGFFQADLVRGAVASSLTGPLYGPQQRLLAAALGKTAGCPTLTPGFWKNWASCASSNGNQAFVLDETLALAGGSILIGDLSVDSCLDAVRILSTKTITGFSMNSNAAYKLAKHLLAAKLNFIAGAESCSQATSAANAAQALLDAIGFTGVGSPAMTAARVTQANNLGATLDSYNNGTLC